MDEMEDVFQAEWERMGEAAAIRAEIRTARDILKEENERLREAILSARRYVNSGEQAEDAGRYLWCLDNPAKAANIFIQWRSRHAAGSNNQPGVHPNERIDAAKEDDDSLPTK
jgi:hypothetical protein